MTGFGGGDDARVGEVTRGSVDVDDTVARGDEGEYVFVARRRRCHKQARHFEKRAVDFERNVTVASVIVNAAVLGFDDGGKMVVQRACENQATAYNRENKAERNAPFARDMDERRKYDDAIGKRVVVVRCEQRQSRAKRMAGDKDFFVAGPKPCHLIADGVEPTVERGVTLEAQGDGDVRQPHDAARGVGEVVDARREELVGVGRVGKTVDEENGGATRAVECVGCGIGEDAVGVARDGAFPTAVAPPNRKRMERVGGEEREEEIEKTDGHASENTRHAASFSR